MRTMPFVVARDDVKLPGGVAVPEEPRAFVLFLHGIPSGRPPEPGDTDTGYPGLAQRFAERHDVAAGWFDMSGVREATGNYSPFAWEADVHAVLDHLRDWDALSGLPRVLVGNSGSGPTAIRVAAARADVDALATLAAVGTWTEPGFVQDAETWLLHLRSIGIIRDPAFPADIERWFDEFRRDGREAIAQIASRPVLIVHGEGDEVVPYHHAELLYEAAAAPKELVRIPGGAHQLRRDERALTALAAWIDATVLRR